MTMIGPEDENWRPDLIEPECAPHLFLSGVEVEIDQAQGVAQLVGWQDCWLSYRERREKRVVVRIVLPIPTAMALARKLGEQQTTHRLPAQRLRSCNEDFTRQEMRQGRLAFGRRPYFPLCVLQPPRSADGLGRPEKGESKSRSVSDAKEALERGVL